MRFTKQVLEIARSAVQKHSNVKKATDVAEREIRALPNFQSLVNSLVRSAVQGLVYEFRHSANVSLKKQNGRYGGKATVVVGKSTRLRAVYQSIYDLRIAGTLLGLIYGRDLPDVASQERTTGNGHLANAELVEALIPLVPPGSRVRDAVSTTKLKKLFQQVQKKTKMVA
jgi:hypothetical protein